jgi:aldehyde dehydrogenase (NAD+)
VLLDDIELTDGVVRELIDGAMANSGQICMAQTRILAPRSRYQEVLAALASGVEGLRVGDPAEEGIDLGPVINAAARSRIEGTVDAAAAAGARIVAGGGRSSLPVGHYVQPTLLTDVDPAAPIAREEVFGPVALVLPYDDERQAVRIANSTDYGLAGSVWSSDPSRAETIAARLITGSVAINSSGAMDFGSPFGGMRRSGIGREGGPEGIGAYIEEQSIIFPPAGGAKH